jgi:hypothetical protein
MAFDLDPSADHLFPALAMLPGVAYNAPPPHLMADAIAHVTAQMAQVPPDAHGAIVAVGNREGVNAALALHGPMGVEVVAWVGKSWTGPIDYGISAVKVF